MHSHAHTLELRIEMAGKVVHLTAKEPGIFLWGVWAEQNKANWRGRIGFIFIRWTRAWLQMNANVHLTSVQFNFEEGERVFPMFTGCLSLQLPKSAPQTWTQCAASRRAGGVFLIKSQGYICVFVWISTYSLFFHRFFFCLRSRCSLII